jgi:hypothetical protein
MARREMASFILNSWYVARCQGQLPDFWPMHVHVSVRTIRIYCSLTQTQTQTTLS